MHPQKITTHADLYVGARMRERRIMLGITQEQIAELIGVTYQQAHKYEKGVNRISAGRLFKIAQALGVGVDYFYEGLGSADAKMPTEPNHKLCQSLAANFYSISNQKHQRAICALARALADEPEAGARSDG